MKWSKKYLEIYEKPYSNIRNEVFDLVESNLKMFNNENPIATVAIISHNDEKRLLSCIWSLSDSKTKYPIEIIGINNASTDNTEKIYKRVNLKYYYESRKGFGFARQCGLDNAKGKYYICIDSDTIYPNKYIEKVIDEFEKEKSVVGVSVQYSIIYKTCQERIFYFFYEIIRNIFNRLVRVNRPERVVRGLAFSHNTEIGKKIGYKLNIKRGSDGSMAFNLKKFGEIKFVRNRKISPISRSSIFGDSNKFSSLFLKIYDEIKHIKRYFVKLKELKDEESNLMK